MGCHLSQRFSFYTMMFLTSSYFVVEIVVGYVTNSMAMVADSFHMLSDLLSLLVGFTALRLATKDEENQYYEQGSKGSNQCTVHRAVNGSIQRAFESRRLLQPQVFPNAVEYYHSIVDGVTDNG